MRMLTRLLIATLFISAGLPSAGAARGLSLADRAFQEGDFKHAATAYRELAARDPKDIHVLLRLGDLALFANELTEAARDYRRALALDPANEWAIRSLTFVRERLGSRDAYVIESRNARAAILPFVVTDPLPVVKVRLNNQRDAYFLIDTGAPGIVLDPATARALGLKVENAGEGTFAGGLRAPIQKSTLDSIACGRISMTRVPVSIVPLAGAPAPRGMHIEGILGTTFFYHFLTTLEYEDGRLILAPRSASRAFEALAKRRGDSTVPLWYVPDHFLFARARINDGHRGLFSIDTGGAGIGIQATMATIHDAHIALDYAHKRNFIGGGGPGTMVPFTASATVGAVTVEGIPGSYLPNGNQYGIFPFTVAGSISHSFFRHLAVTFDFSAMRMVLSRASMSGRSRAQAGRWPATEKRG